MITKEYLDNLGWFFYGEGSCSSRLSYKEGFYSIPNCELYGELTDDNILKVGTLDYITEQFSVVFELKTKEQVSNSLTFLKSLKEEEEEISGYCKICGSCGESGCCPPTMCKNHPDGDYCDSNIKELKLEYIVSQKFLKFLYTNCQDYKDIIETYEAIWDSEYDKFHKDDNCLQQK